MPEPFPVTEDTIKALSPAEQLIAQALIKLGRWQIVDKNKAEATR